MTPSRGQAGQHTRVGTYYLGVDGGNSKTIALIAEPDGGIIGVGRAGCSDIYGAPSVDSALEEIERAVTTAAELSGVALPRVSHGAFSLAGADWPEDFELLRDELTARGLARSVRVLNDAFGALRAGSADGTGVAVVVGTGAALGARAGNGRSWHTSWWQEPQGSRQLAEMALRAICRSELGIDPPTTMTGHALRVFDRASVESMLHLLTRRERAGRPRPTPLTAVLLAEAETGDAVAREIVYRHGSALGDFALAAARRVGLSGEPFSLVLSGGVFKAQGRLLQRSLCERVLAHEPHVVPVTPCYEPAVGALLLAFDAAGTAVDSHIESRLLATLPSPTVFATDP